MDLASYRVDVAAENTTRVTPTELRYGPAFEAWSGERSSSIRSGSGSINPRSALTLAAYYAAINVLATDLACLPLKIFRKRKSGYTDVVTDDSRSGFLELSPDGKTTSMRLRQAILGHMFGWGNGYIEIGFSGGVVDGLYWLEPTTEPSYRSQDKKLYYLLPDGTTRPPYKIIHLAGFGYDGLCGYSPARLHAQTIKIGKNAETFGGSFFDNGIQASGHFESPNKMTPEAAAEFRREMNAAHVGAHNAGKFMVLWNGLKWTQTTIPPQDAQFLETRQFQVQEIARMFRLPPHKLGDLSHATYSNIEEANIDYKITVLMPWCKSIEQELNQKLFTKEEQDRGYYVKHNMEAFQRGNAASRLAWYQGMFGLGAYTIDDIREYEDLNPIEKFGDERFLTVQAQPLSVVLNPPKPPAPAPAPDPGQNDGNGGEPPAKPANGKLPVPSVNGKRFAHVNGHAELVGVTRENPHHGADGKFSSGPGSLAGHAPESTATGSKLAVEEGPPLSAADKKHAANAEANGKTAIRMEDKPDLAIDKQSTHTDYKVGGKLDAKVESFTDKDDFGKSYKGWQVTSYDRESGSPVDTQRYNSRRTAESIAKDQAKATQRDDVTTARVNTKDPSAFVGQARTAHSIANEGSGRKDPSDSSWTTMYRVFKKPEG